MTRKSSSTRKPRASKAAKVLVTVASLVGYDPTLLLAAPAKAAVQAPIIELPVSENAHLAEFALGFDLATLTPPTQDPVENLAAPIGFDDLPVEAPPTAPAMSAFEGFRAYFAGIEPFEVGNAGHAVIARFRDRCRYEAEKNPDNTNIQRTLKKAHAALTHDLALRVLLACEVDESFISRGLREGSAYNVYAIDKAQDLVGFLAGNPSLNAINRAVLRTMLEFEAEGIDFTMEHAKAAASDKIRVEPRLRPLMRSHTVSASTAPTQASSTMQALVTLGIVEASGKGGTKNPTYRFTEAMQAKAMKDRLAS